MSTVMSSPLVLTYAATDLDAFLGAGAADAIQCLEDHLSAGGSIENTSGDLHYLADRGFHLPEKVLTAVQSGIDHVNAFACNSYLFYVSGPIRLVIAESSSQRRLFLYVVGSASLAEGTAIGNYMELQATDGALSDGQIKDTLLISDGSGLSGMGGNMAIGNSLAGELMKRPNFKQQIVFFRDENSARDAMLKVIFNLLKMKLRTVGGLENAIAEAKAQGF
jgi:hypothetical protein